MLGGDGGGGDIPDSWGKGKEFGVIKKGTWEWSGVVDGGQKEKVK
jgi:hypothetical protein